MKNRTVPGTLSPFPILLIAITLLVYGNSFVNSFVYDDYAFIVENQSIRRLDIESVISNFTDKSTIAATATMSEDKWRPLTTTSFAIDYKFFGLDPRYYHVENVMLHAVNGILVYMMTALITGNAFITFIASLIFVIHPVQTESVTAICGRSNILFLIFYLSSFIFHIKNRRYGHSALHYTLSVTLFIFSLLSKEMAVTLPLLFIWYDIQFYSKRELRSYIQYYFPFLLLEASYLAARFSVLGLITTKENWWGGGIYYTIPVTIRAIVEYMRLLILPVNF